MFRLVRMELKRLRFSKSLYFTILAYVITFFSGKGFYAAVAHKGAVTLVDAIGAFSGSSSFLFLFVPIFVCAYVQLDYQSGHIKNIVTGTKDKGSVLTIKLATLAVLSFVFMTVTVLGLFLSAGAHAKQGITLGNPLEVLFVFVEVYMMFLFVLCLYLLFSAIFRKELVSLIADLLVTIGVPLGLSLAPYPWLNSIVKYLVLNNVTEADAVTSMGMRGLMLGLSCVYCVILVCVMKMILRKRDVQV